MNLYGKETCFPEMLADLIVLEYDYTRYYSYYRNLLDNNIDIPRELVFLCNIPKKDAYMLINLLKKYNVEIPGCSGCSSKDNDDFYFDVVKKEFLARKNNIEFQFPEEYKPTVIAKSVFPSQEVQNICYGATRAKGK